MRQFHPKSYLVMLCLLLATTACRPSEASSTLQPGAVEVPFETVAIEEWGSGYEGIEPQVFLLTETEDIAKVEQLVNSEHLEQLRQVDFERYAIITVFQGVQPSSNHKVVIERIMMYDALLTVYAKFWQPSPTQGGAAQITSPYHLVKVKKDSFATMPTEVKLVSDVVQP